MERNRLPSFFNKKYFWDCNFKKLNLKKDAGFIMERIVWRGLNDDFFKMIEYYGDNFFKKKIVTARYLDARTLNFISMYCNIPKNKFTCYKRNRSLTGPWN